ncbi:ABC transporter substrate-binding protein [Microbacterium sp. W4I20]|uniref:ABC transporter substrate-binding protein n=1 Tax=Microbacterium sp. W4I20 TaxID=3042262 RepID=UPI00278600D8|nr:ABC transporter substrate-binding protein [Microbacterium sp. W4I20]MDQ0726632.1 peptide/nickel transport system substrate-binding protein [Microbacterium sp. W4I20]
MNAPRTRRTLAATAAAAALALALTACNSGAVAAPPADAERVDGGTIVYAHQQEPQCLFGGWIEQAYISYQFLDSLVSLTEEGEAVPWLAEDWAVSDDGLTYTLTLKEGVEFTDGTPVDAEAIAYNFDYWVAGGNSTAAVWLGGYYESAEAVDERTVAVHLSRPYTRFIENLAQGYFGIQSQQALETRTDEENCEQPIGSGAFVVQEWNRGENVVLVRNDEYTSWPENAEHTGPAYVEKVDWRFVADGVTRVSALRSGEADAIYDIPAVEWDGLDGEQYDLHKYVTPGRPQQISFNTTRAPFSDENLRKAFILSLDRKSIVETIGRGVIPFEGNGGVSQATPGYSQKAADWYGFDADEANSLLDEAGWTERDDDGYRVKDGKTLEVVFPYNAGTIINADGATIFQAVQEQAKATGFKVELIPVPPSETWAGTYSGRDAYDISAGYWTSVNAGILYINWRPNTEDNPNFSNSAFYDSAELEGLILAANSESDTEKQNALYGQAQEYIAEHALSFGLYDRLSTLGVNPRLRGVWQENAQGGPTFYDAYFVE